MYLRVAKLREFHASVSGAQDSDGKVFTTMSVKAVLYCTKLEVADKP